MTTRNRKTGDTHDIVLSPKMVGIGAILFLTLLLGPEATKRIVDAWAGTTSPAAQTNESVKELRTEIGGIKSDLSGVKQDVGALKRDVAEVKADVGSVKADTAEVKSKVAKMDLAMQSMQGFIDGIRVPKAKVN